MNQKADIPNTLNFRFIGIRPNGKEETCLVMRHGDGGFTIGAAWSRIIGWREFKPGDESIPYIGAEWEHGSKTHRCFQMLNGENKGVADATFEGRNLIEYFAADGHEKAGTKFLQTCYVLARHEPDLVADLVN